MVRPTVLCSLSLSLLLSFSLFSPSPSPSLFLFLSLTLSLSHSLTLSLSHSLTLSFFISPPPQNTITNLDERMFRPLLSRVVVNSTQPSTVSFVPPPLFFK